MSFKGHKVSVETRRKMSEAKKNYIPWNKGLTKETDIKIAVSEETKQKISEAQKGHIGYWIGKVGPTKGISMPEEQKQKISKANKGCISHNKGVPMLEEQKRKIGEANKGHKISEETRQKMSLAHRGIKHPNWQGGITSIKKQIRHNLLYHQWCSDIFTRDDFTCQECDERGCYLHAHHIKSFASILQYYEVTTLKEALNCGELWNINNGITLCEECHRKIYKYIHKKKEKINC